jgi:hypothetical protein
LGRNHRFPWPPRHPVHKSPLPCRSRRSAAGSKPPPLQTACSGRHRPTPPLLQVARLPQMPQVHAVAAACLCRARRCSLARSSMQALQVFMAMTLTPTSMRPSMARARPQVHGDSRAHDLPWREVVRRSTTTREHTTFHGKVVRVGSVVSRCACGSRRKSMDLGERKQ